MRRKKHKQTRKAIRFYKINFGFRPPFKVILDGNFVHALEALK
jgi:U3 small nucleolar RNA-associated protein 23